MERRLTGTPMQATCKASPFEVDEEPGEPECGCDDGTCIDVPEEGESQGTKAAAPSHAPSPDGGKSENRKGSYLQAAVRALMRRQAADWPPQASSAGETTAGSSSEEAGHPTSSCSASDSVGVPGVPGWTHWTCKGHQSCGYRHNHLMSASCTACGRFWTGRKKVRKKNSSGGSAVGPGPASSTAVSRDGATGQGAFPGGSLEAIEGRQRERAWEQLRQYGASCHDGRCRRQSCHLPGSHPRRARQRTLIREAAPGVLRGRSYSSAVQGLRRLL